jgi:hypothetical protein
VVTRLLQWPNIRTATEIAELSNNNNNNNNNKEGQYGKIFKM